MQRLRFYDLLIGRLPKLLGFCASDANSVASYVNSAQRQLLLCRESGEEGWYGTFAEVLLSLDTSDEDQVPILILPRGIARLEAVTVCDDVIDVQNQFYEYLKFGNGRLPKQTWECRQRLAFYSRNNVATLRLLPDTGMFIRAYLTDPTDQAKRVLIQGTDVNDTRVNTRDGGVMVDGEFISLDFPFVDTVFTYNTVTGLQKDLTAGQVQIYAVDFNTGEETLINQMDPSETTAWYRAYHMENLPANCCPTCTSATEDTTVHVRAIVKLDLIPVRVPTDYLLLQNEEAIIEKCQGLRYSEIDSINAKSMGQEKHVQAIRLLNGELNHYLGAEQPALIFKPFGSARLERKKVGTLY